MARRPVKDYKRAAVGWEVPMTRYELEREIETTKARLKVLEDELYNRVNSNRLEAIAKVRNLMRGYEISIEEVLPPKKERKKKV
jgi:hypothetical protein